MTININGIDIHYQVEGQGPPLLLLHGWGAVINTFYPVIMGMRATRTVYALEFPGHGESGLSEEPLSISDNGAMVRRFMESLGILGCDALCHSYGARVAIKMAASDPLTFRRLIFTGGAGIRPPRKLRYYWQVYTYKVFRHAARIRPLVFFCKLWGLNIDEKVKRSGSPEYRMLSDVMKGTFSKAVNEDLTRYLPEIQNPTLLIWGKEDEETPLWMGQKMETLIPDSGLIVWEEAGHFPFLDRPEGFNIVVTHFLDH